MSQAQAQQAQQALQQIEQENRDLIVKLYRAEREVTDLRTNINNLAVGFGRAAGFTEEELANGVEIDSILERVADAFSESVDTDQSESQEPELLVEKD